ncbi:MAG: hypothetical protein AWL62_2915, partial [Halanaerobium sp. T82-1]
INLPPLAGIYLKYKPAKIDKKEKTKAEVKNKKINENTNKK